MVPSQLEKLKRDSRELTHHIARMKKEGRSDVAVRLMSKKAHIESYIESMLNDDDISSYRQAYKH